jgi:hypothetical protein
MNAGYQSVRDGAAEDRPMLPSDTADPVTVLRVHKASHPPGLALIYLCPRSLAARLAADAQGSDDDVADLGPGALLYAQAAKPAEFHRDGHHYLVLVGIAQGDRWTLWTPPAPVEPVPGSPGAAAQAN